MSSSRERKNLKIKETLLATRAKRTRQVPVVLTFKVRNEKRNRKAGIFNHLKTLFIEAKWVWNSIIAQSDKKTCGDSARKLSSFKQQEFKTVVHRDFEGNDVTSEVTFLMSSLRDSIITRAKRSVKSLKTKKDNVAKKSYKSKTDNIGHLKFKSEITAIDLKQYGTTHYLVNDNVYHIQGLDADIRVAGGKQLRQLKKLYSEYDIASAIIVYERGDYYIKQTVYVDADEYYRIKESKKSYKRDENAFDFGCTDTLTDAYGNQFNCQVEEPERLKRLQRSQRRKLIAAGWKPNGGKQQKIKRSNNWYRDLKKLQKEYAKLDKKKDAEAIKISHQILSENRTVVMQDEQVSKWQKTGHGKKVQHGILGRLKTRLMRSRQTHVMSKWVPTTKLCTHCGQTWDGIKVKDRQFECPHCGHDDGPRDQHSAKDMLWLFRNMKEYIGLDGSEFKRADFDSRLLELFPDRSVVEGCTSGTA